MLTGGDVDAWTTAQTTQPLVRNIKASCKAEINHSKWGQLIKKTF